MDSSNTNSSVDEATHNKSSTEKKKKKQMDDLPPGFRFHPTDEELITHYLCNKLRDSKFSARAVADVDLNKCEPWDLPAKAKMGVKEWYFFSLRDRKYPTGVRTNRATAAGYWKTTGKDKEIYRTGGASDGAAAGNPHHQDLILIGMKKTLVFYKGRAPRGEKTSWVIHEYRHIPCKSTSTSPPKNAVTASKDEWVVCRVFKKSVCIVRKLPAVNNLQSRQNLLNAPYNYMNQMQLQRLMPPHYNLFPSATAAGGGGGGDPYMNQMLAMHHAGGGSSHLFMNTATNTDLPDLTRLLRTNSVLQNGGNNLQQMQQYGQYESASLPSADAAGGSFSVSGGLKLNLGTPAAPLAQPQHHQPQQQQQDVAYFDNPQLAGITETAYLPALAAGGQMQTNGSSHVMNHGHSVTTGGSLIMTSASHNSGSLRSSTTTSTFRAMEAAQPCLDQQFDGYWSQYIG